MNDEPTTTTTKSESGFVRRFFSQTDLLPKTVNLLFAFIALALIALSFLRPWYALPQLSPEDGHYFTCDTFLTFPFKIAQLLLYTLGIIGLLGILLFKKLPYSAGLLLLRFAGLALFVTLIFPTFLILFDSDSSGDGAWLQQQHDTMTWLGGDIYRAHSERSIESGTGVNAQDPPERLAVFRPPTASLGLDRLNDWIWWLGYGPAWTQFAGKGWFFSSIGNGLLSICLFGYYWRKHIPTARFYLRKIILQQAVCFSLFFALVFSLYAITRSTLRDAEDATAHGHYDKAYQHLNRANNFIPSLRNDSGIIRQLGYFQWQLNQKEAPECQLYQIFWLDLNGYHDRAGTLMDKLYTQGKELPRHCARELARHQLRVAINDINSAKTTPALQHLSKLLHREPNCLQAHFHTQFANLQSDNLQQNRQAHAQVLTLYEGYKSKNKRGVIATSYWLLAQAETKAGNADAAREARLKSKGQ